MLDQEAPQVRHVHQSLVDLDQIGSNKGRIRHGRLAIVARQIALGECGPVDGAQESVHVYGKR